MTLAYYRSFIKDNVVVIAGHIFVYLRGIILMPLIIKTIGTTLYGGFVLLSSILGIIFGISSFGAGFKSKRYLPSANEKEDITSLFFPQFTFHFLSILLFSALLLVFNKQLNTFLLKGEVDYQVCILPVYLVTYFLYTQSTDYFRFTSRVHYMTVATLLFPYLHIFIIILLYLFFQYVNIDALLLGHAIAAFAIALPCFCMLINEIGLHIQFYKWKDLVIDLKLGFPLTLGFIVDFILAGSDRYIISFYMSVSDVGFYNPGYVVGSLIAFLPKAMGTVIPQLLSKAVDNQDFPAAHRMVDYSAKIFIVMGIPFILGSLVLGRPILQILANTETAQRSFYIIPIVATGTVFYGLSLLYTNVLFVKMKTYAIFKMNLYAAIINLAANLFLLYFFRDIIVAGITTLISYMIAFVYIITLVKKEKWPIYIDFRLIFKSILAAGIMVLFLRYFIPSAGGNGEIFYYILWSVIGMILYFFIFLLTGGISKEEFDYIKSSLNRYLKNSQ